MTTSFQPFYIQPGEHIGAYVIRKAIGRGGAQMAYLANAPNGHRVVLKMSLSPKGRESSGERLMHERFMSQVGNFINLRGTLGVAAVFAHDMFPDQSESGYAYMVQEWIPGNINVLDWYRDEPHKLKKVLGGFITLANACGEMKLRGICHRDLKPENILVTPNGIPKIVDFDSSKNAGARRLTAKAPGAWPGTQLYYSPEVCRAILSNPASLHKIPIEDLFAGDLHALGVIFYQVLTGEYPFDENAPPEKLFEQIAYEVPVRPRTLNPEVPFGLDKVTMKLLQKKPEQRYQFGGHVVTDLKALLETDEYWERPFQTPAGEQRGSRPSTSRTGPGAPLLTPVPAACEGSAALELAPAAIILAPPRSLAVIGVRDIPRVAPAPRPARRPRLALLVAAALLLASLVPALYFRQHGAAGPFVERGTALVGQVKTAVVAVVTMVFTACTGLFGEVRTVENWMAKCSPGSRNVPAELDFDPDLGLGDVLPGPNAILPDDGGMEVRDGPIEVSAALPGSSKAVSGKLIGVAQTNSKGAFLLFDKMQLFNGTEPEDAPPAGRIIDICAYASERGYGGDMIPKAIDPPPASERHPGFTFVTSSQLTIHFAH